MGGDSHTPPSVGGVGFSLATIDAPTDGANYASFPATCGLHRIEYQSRSYQVSGTVSTYQQDVEIDGTLQGNAAQWWLNIFGSTVGAVNVSYAPSGRWGYKWLPRGVHTVTVKVRQDSFAIGRTFADRTLAVTLAS